MSKRILVLSASVGAGHLRAAQAVEKALKMMPGINGFYGATSMERLPVERAIKEQVHKFTMMKTSPFKG
jgi:predicted TIM-barrel enzyme